MNVIETDIPLPPSTLRSGQSYVLDAILDHDPWLLRFDGLKKVEGSSELGDFHYVPILFREAPSVGKAQRLFLELCGWLLTPIQGKHPAYLVSSVIEMAPLLIRSTDVSRSSTALVIMRSASRPT